MTINLNPIVDAVRAARAQLAPGAAALAAAILAGDETALTEGTELMAGTDQLVADLGALVDNTRHADHLQVEHCLGIDGVIDAVLIATGEVEADDPDINERFRPVRLERQRGWYAQKVRELSDCSVERPLSRDEQSWLGRCSHDLDLIAAGIEPA